MIETIYDILLHVFAIFGLICAVFFAIMYYVIKEDSKAPTSKQVYDAEKKRREYASKS